MKIKNDGLCNKFQIKTAVRLYKSFVLYKTEANLALSNEEQYRDSVSPESSLFISCGCKK